MWTNLSNSKRYIGSSVNLKCRILEYYNVNRLLKMPSMVINNAILKYGYLNFSFSIIEFCEIKDLQNKEKYYFELLKPEYNILKEPRFPSKGKGWKPGGGILSCVLIFLWSGSVKKRKVLLFLLLWIRYQRLLCCQPS